MRARHDPVQLFLHALDAGDVATATALAAALGADPWLCERADRALCRRPRQAAARAPGARPLVAALAARLGLA